jgi:hypothetical protein
MIDLRHTALSDELNSQPLVFDDRDAVDSAFPSRCAIGLRLGRGAHCRRSGAGSGQSVWPVVPSQIGRSGVGSGRCVRAPDGGRFSSSSCHWWRVPTRASQPPSLRPHQRPPGSGPGPAARQTGRPHRCGSTPRHGPGTSPTAGCAARRSARSASAGPTSTPCWRNTCQAGRRATPAPARQRPPIGPAASGVHQTRADRPAQSDPVPLENRILCGEPRLLGVHAARKYSLVRPLRTGFRRIWRAWKFPAVMQGGWCSASGTRWPIPWCGRAVL